MEKGRVVRRHWAFVDADIQAATSLEEVLRAFRFEPVQTPDGGLVGVVLDGGTRSQGDEIHLWNVLAPFVEAGGYMVWHLEEGRVQRWEFDGSRLVVRKGTIDFGGVPTDGDSPAVPPQYVHLLVTSEDLDPEALTRWIGVEPSRSWRKGSKRAEPSPVPRTNGWDLRAPNADHASMRDQLDALLPLIRDATPGIAALRSGHEVGVVLSLYRRVAGLSEGHALGLHFSDELLEALGAIGAAIDIDEYNL